MKAKCRKCSKVFADESLLEAHIEAMHADPGPQEEDIDRAARAAIYDFLASDGRDAGLRERARQANSYRSTEARREQTNSARDATLVVMARELAESKGEFRQLMAVAMPNSPLLAVIQRKQVESKISEA